MTVITFDTLKYAKTLTEADVPAAQAEALAMVIEDQIATKQDLKLLQMQILTKLGGLILACTALLSVVISAHH